MYSQRPPPPPMVDHDSMISSFIEMAFLLISLVLVMVGQGLCIKPTMAWYNFEEIKVDRNLQPMDEKFNDKYIAFCTPMNRISIDVWHMAGMADHMIGQYIVVALTFVVVILVIVRGLGFMRTKRTVHMIFSAVCATLCFILAAMEIWYTVVGYEYMTYRPTTTTTTTAPPTARFGPHEPDHQRLKRQSPFEYGFRGFGQGFGIAPHFLGIEGEKWFTVYNESWAAASAFYILLALLFLYDVLREKLVRYVPFQSQPAVTPVPQEPMPPRQQESIHHRTQESAHRPKQQESMHHRPQESTHRPKQQPQESSHRRPQESAHHPRQQESSHPRQQPQESNHHRPHESTNHHRQHPHESNHHRQQESSHPRLQLQDQSSHPRQQEVKMVAE